MSSRQIIDQIRKQAKTEELNYLFLMSCLSSYKQPRDKLTALLKAESIIRVKKGIYVFGREYRKRPYSLEVLANLIYGPSYVSFEYALGYYNLIPEKVVRVTSACPKRIKHYHTPLADFTYYYVPFTKYPVGMTLESVDDDTHFLIATKEKALADYLARIKPFSEKREVVDFLVEGMRIDPSDLAQFNLPLLREIAAVYQHPNIDFLCQTRLKL